MKYMGSKRRHAKELLDIMLLHRKPGQIFYDLFAGGFNLIDKVPPPRVANDVNKYVISLFKELQHNSNIEFPFIGEEEYKNIKNNKDEYPDWLVGYVGFNLSFGAKWFGGYCRDKAGVRNYQNEAQQNLKAQQKNISNITIYNLSYDQVPILPKSIIYCDIPYKGTQSYSGTKGFDYNQFYNWCRECYKAGHQIYISEYNMPDDFICIWSKEVNNTLDLNTGDKKGIEKLFTLNKELFENMEDEIDIYNLF